MSNTGKQKFDGYASKYDEWFMVNDNLFTSELRLFKKVLGVDIPNPLPHQKIWVR